MVTLVTMVIEPLIDSSTTADWLICTGLNALVPGRLNSS